jgi:hypothetical protein
MSSPTIDPLLQDKQWQVLQMGLGKYFLLLKDEAMEIYLYYKSKIEFHS